MDDAETKPERAKAGRMWRALVAVGIIAGAYLLLPVLVRELFPAALPTAKFVAYSAPRPVDNASFVDEAGNRLSLDDFRGTFLLVNVWATWCQPCRDEMASLNKLASILGGQGVKILPLSVDVAGVPAVRAFYRRYGLDKLGIYVDDTTGALDALGVGGIPSTLLIDPDGRELGRMIGPAQWDTPETIDAISEKTGLALKKGVAASPQ